MNNNAAADFASIDKEINTDNGRSNYAFHRLMDKGIIRKGYGHYVQAKFMHGKYRLFEATSIYDPELAKITGLSNTAVNYHLRNLERKYDIKYILELDIEKFGYMNYIAFVKFKDKRPTYEEMKKQLEAIPYVQVAMTTKGSYMLVASKSLYFPCINFAWT